MELDEDSLRSIRYKVDKNSIILNKMTDQIVAKYSKQLDDVINTFKDTLSKSDKMSNDEIEKLTLMIPTMLYFTVSGLESLGVNTDSAKAVKMEAYNDFFIAAKGTIPDKEAKAESLAVKEQLVEVIFSRAYKQLKIKSDIALQLCLSSRKVLEKRTMELRIDSMDGVVTKDDKHHY